MGNSTQAEQNHVQQLASSLASVASNANRVHLLVFGGGRGGQAMLDVLRHYDWVDIQAIVDIHAQAIAFPLAEKLGIPTSTDGQQTLNTFTGDIVIDVTGDHGMAEELKTSLINRHIELISGKSAKLVFDLVNTQIIHSKTIDSQNTRLELLENMLNITSQLENRPALANILHTSLLSLQTHVQAEHGLVLIFHPDRSSEVTHAVNTAIPSYHQSIGFEIKSICRDIDKQQRFKVLSQPLVNGITNTNLSYNIILPLWYNGCLVAALLMHLPGELSREQQTILNMSSIHLNTATKTLQQFKHLENIATNDALTGIFNRRYFDQKLNEEVSRIQRSKLATLTCTFVDIDDFKPVNDNYGHQVGDIVLKEVAKSISYSIRDYDTCARYGGDEFVILLPADSLEGLDHIEQVGLRMLKHIAEINIPNFPELKIRASIGMATQSSEILDGERLLKLADIALYQAKEAGKGCLRIHTDEQFHYSDDDI